MGGNQLRCEIGEVVPVGEPPLCEPIMCSEPSIQDGSFSPAQPEIPLGANYEVTCNSGFELIGSSTVTCTEGGLTTTPTCDPG